MSDLIDRQAVIESIRECAETAHDNSEWDMEQGYLNAIECVEEEPSAQPERKCVNCGRTANNGGWHENGRTRCPIEEHYALPKDGYCHLW